MAEPFTRILIQRVVPTGNGPQVTRDQQSFRLVTKKLTTQEVYDKIMSVLGETEEESDDFIDNFLGQQQS
jgi:hypothetical protein